MLGAVARQYIEADLPQATQPFPATCYLSLPRSAPRVIHSDVLLTLAAPPTNPNHHEPTAVDTAAPKYHTTHQFSLADTIPVRGNEITS